jgi:hypothetical protein
MGILSDLIEGKINIGQAIQEVETWAEDLVKGVENNPTVQAAAATLKTDAASALNVAEGLGQTFFTHELSVLASEVEAAIAKYGASVAGGGPITGAVLQVVSDALPVATAAVKAGVTALQAASAGA